MQQTFVLYHKTPALRRQNFQTEARRLQTCGKSVYCVLKFFFLVYYKNSIFTEKIAIIHTFSGLGTLSELLAHFLDGMLLS
jgi:hypothetical protein